MDGMGCVFTFGSATVTWFDWLHDHTRSAFNFCARSSQIAASVACEQLVVVQPVSRHEAGTQAQRVPSALKFTMQQCCSLPAAVVVPAVLVPQSSWHGTALEKALSTTHRLQYILLCSLPLFLRLCEFATGTCKALPPPGACPPHSCSTSGCLAANSLPLGWTFTIFSGFRAYVYVCSDCGLVVATQPPVC